jgi:hypothetical protein
MLPTILPSDLKARLCLSSAALLVRVVKGALGSFWLLQATISCPVAYGLQSVDGFGGFVIDQNLAGDIREF